MAAGNVRFEGQSGHSADPLRCLLLTQSGSRASKFAVMQKEFPLDVVGYSPSGLGQA
jgi:hypothetical protein